MLTLHPAAKINFCLEVLGRRPDGYHDLVTAIQTVDWTDDLTVEHADTLSFSCSEPSLTNEDNLVLRAARLLQAQTRTPKGARITLIKRIPAGAGLGGGSSDAASTLHALNTLWNLGLDKEDLVIIAAQLGSDVPFFLYGGTALAEGRGERVTRLPCAPDGWAVLVAPPLSLERKTQRLFSLLRPEHFSNGDVTRSWTHALGGGRSWQDMPTTVNTFEQVADSAFPGLARYREAFHNGGAGSVHLSGAGPTLFSISPYEEDARRVCRALQTMDARVHAARLIG